MLQKTFGTILSTPVLKQVVEDNTEFEAAENARRKLVGLHTCGGYLVDITGFRKTLISVCYLNALAKYYPGQTGLDPTTIEHQLYLILTMTGPVIHQWIDTIRQEAPDMCVIVAYGLSAPTGMSSSWVTDKAT